MKVKEFVYLKEMLTVAQMDKSQRLDIIQEINNQKRAIIEETISKYDEIINKIIDMIANEGE